MGAEYDVVQDSLFVGLEKGQQRRRNKTGKTMVEKEYKRSRSTDVLTHKVVQFSSRSLDTVCHPILALPPLPLY